MVKTDRETRLVLDDLSFKERIKQETLDVMLNGYALATGCSPTGTKCLEDATYIGKGKADGRFKINRHWYYGAPADNSLYHLTEVEATLAFNQIGYALMAHLLETGKIAKLGIMTPKEFKSIQTHGSWIRESSYEYSKPIPLAETDGVFNAVLNLSEVSLDERSRLFSLKTIMEIDFQNGSATGKRDIRFIFPKKNVSGLQC